SVRARRGGRSSGTERTYPTGVDERRERVEAVSRDAGGRRCAPGSVAPPTPGRRAVGGRPRPRGPPPPRSRSGRAARPPTSPPAPRRRRGGRAGRRRVAGGREGPRATGRLRRWTEHGGWGSATRRLGPPPRRATSRGRPVSGRRTRGAR